MRNAERMAVEEVAAERARESGEAVVVAERPKRSRVRKVIYLNLFGKFLCTRGAVACD